MKFVWGQRGGGGVHGTAVVLEWALLSMIAAGLVNLGQQRNELTRLQSTLLADLST